MIVLGHREPSVSPEHRISDESRARLRRAERECRRDPPRAVILTGYTRSGGRSEAEQMEEEWSLPEVPVLLEDAGRNTAENASRSLPIIRAIGAIRRVTVVTSAWHLRAPYFFAPYRVFGLRLGLPSDSSRKLAANALARAPEPARAPEGAPQGNGLDAAPSGGVTAFTGGGPAGRRLKMSSLLCQVIFARSGLLS